MKLDRYTEKAQEAILAAQRTAEELQSPVLDAEHLLHALVEPDDGIPAETLRRLGVDLPDFRGELAGDPRPAGEDPGRLAGASTRGRSARWSWPSRRPAGSATSTSRPSTCSSAIAEVGGEGRELLDRHGADARGDPQRAPERPRRPARHVADPGGHVRRAREVRPRPHRRGPRRQARPGHRPRRGDPAGHPGPQPADEEQPGPDRRARRRQDGHRRGPRPADRPRRRARDASRTSGSSRSTSAR